LSTGESDEKAGMAKEMGELTENNREIIGEKTGKRRKKRNQNENWRDVKSILEKGDGARGIPQEKRNWPALRKEPLYFHTSL